MTGREIPITFQQWRETRAAPKVRRITIKTPISHPYDYTMVYLADEMKDSEALAYTLNQIDPGEEYIVVFTTTTYEDKTWTTPLEINVVHHNERT
jgi:hypothetical protein